MNPTYALIMALAIVAGAIISRSTQRSLSLSRRERLGVALGAFCGAMIGAKIPFLIADLPGLLNGTVWFSDGKTILCGLVGGYLGVEIAKWNMGIRVKTGDTFVVPVAVAIGIGRLACFQIGCCFGTPTDLPWGVVFPIDALRRHPTQLYESAFHLTAACVFFTLQREGRFRGQLIKLYIMVYLVYRFATEFIRPEARLLGGLTGYQWASIGLMALFIALWLRDAKTERRLAPPDVLGDPNK